MRKDDVVIIKGGDGFPRNKWQLARITETHQSADGHVRTVKLAIADSTLDNKGRRIKKLVLLQEGSET